MAKDKTKTKKKGGYSVFGSSSNDSTTAPKRSLRPRRKANQNSATADDARLRHAVEVDGLRTIIDIEPDGNCLFRSISDQLNYDYGSSHAEVRDDVCNFVQGHQDSFGFFLVLDDDDEDAADFDSYVSTMRQDGEWGGHVELVAASRMYRRNITVFTSDLAKYTIEHGSPKASAGPDLLLSYHDNDHYNSVRTSTGSKPPPPIKTFVLEALDETTIATNDSEMELDHPTCTPAVASSEQSDQASKDQAQSGMPKQLHGPCHCGSGKRYKKCCGVGTKKASRVKKQRNVDIVSEGGTDEQIMDGTFRVLHI